MTTGLWRRWRGRYSTWHFDGRVVWGFVSRGSQFAQLFWTFCPFCLFCHCAYCQIVWRCPRSKAAIFSDITLGLNIIFPNNINIVMWGWIMARYQSLPAKSNEVYQRSEMRRCIALWFFAWWLAMAYQAVRRVLNITSKVSLDAKRFVLVHVSKHL